MGITDLTDIVDFNKIVLIEWCVGWEMPLDNWTIDSNGIYQHAVPDYIGEIVRVEQTGDEMTRVFSYADMVGSTAGHFYHDLRGGIIYIKTFDTGAPDASGNIFIAYFWLGFINAQDPDYICGFAPRFGETDGATDDIYYMPFLDVASIPAVTQGVGDYYSGAMTIQFGSLAFLNDGYWWRLKNNNILLHNKDVWVKVGEKDSDYADFVTIFPGVSMMPEFSDGSLIVGIRDRRTAEFIDIPVDRIDPAVYTNVAESDANRVYPILFGEKEDITPVIRDTTTYSMFAACGTVGGVNYGIESIEAIYKDGVELVETDDWSVNLNTGRITLVEDPGDANITVHAKGVKCEYDFTTSGGPTLTGNYSTNVADILYFILNVMNGIPHERLDAESFAALQAQRTQHISLFLEAETKTIDVVRLLQSSCIFHLVPKLDGSYMVRYYDRATPAGTPVFWDEDYTQFTLVEDTETNFRSVLLKYDKKPSADEWKTIFKSYDDSFYKHDQEKVLTIQTALRDDTEADGIADFYLALVKEPGDKIKTGLPPQAADMIPTDKLIVNRGIIAGDGEEITIFDEEVFVLLQIQKSISNIRSEVIALKDTHARGITIHADVAHTDTHTDSYTDAGHVDTAHVDTHSDTHTDTPYVDSHGDVAHSDAAHVDSYSDSYSDHTDGGYADHPDYIDTPPHDDSYTDSHGDTGHGDSHTDTHTDTPYVDTYSDSHSDTPHADGHGDIYTDTHGDTPHVDSEI